MSEIETEQQWADQVQTERELEEAFEDIDNGIFLTERQIDLLRFSCGLPLKPKARPSKTLMELFRDYGEIFGAHK